MWLVSTFFEQLQVVKMRGKMLKKRTGLKLSKIFTKNEKSLKKQVNGANCMTHYVEGLVADFTIFRTAVGSKNV